MWFVDFLCTIVHMHMYVPYMCTCIYNTTDTVFYQSNAVATIFSDACFCAVTCIIQDGYYSRMATIRGRLLFEGGNYLRVAFISLESLQTSLMTG